MGDRVTVVFSNDPTTDGGLELPPADTVAERINASAVRWTVVGAAGVLTAVLAWAVPANLRRLDRRDGVRIGDGGPSGQG